MKRQLLAGAVCLSLLAGCGGGDDDKVSTRKRSTTTRQAAATTTTSALEGTTSSSGAAATTTTRRAGSGTTTGAPGTTPAPGVVDGVKATQVAALSAPIAMAVRPGEPGSLYIAQKGGSVRRLTGTSVAPGNVLDISSRVSNGGEQGLLGIAFSPDGNWLYASYTNTAGDTRVAVYPFAGGVANAGAE